MVRNVTADSSSSVLVKANAPLSFLLGAGETHRVGNFTSVLYCRIIATFDPLAGRSADDAHAGVVPAHGQGRDGPQRMQVA